MEYVRRLDTALFAAAQGRAVQRLLDRASGATTCSVSCIKTPPGDGSPEGLHTHEVDQVFYVLDGTMSIEVEGETHECESGTLVVFPAGVPHRNWNGSDRSTLHLTVNAPLPASDRPFATRVEPRG